MLVISFADTSGNRQYYLLNCEGRKGKRERGGGEEWKEEERDKETEKDKETETIQRERQRGSDTINYFISTTHLISSLDFH